MPGFEGIGRIVSWYMLIVKGGISFYFPIVTFLILSAVLTIIINLVLRIIGK